MKTRLLDFTDTDDEDFSGATIRYGIPDELRRVLARSSRWGRVKCQVTYAMTSKYAIALYELVCLRRNKDSCVAVRGRYRVPCRGKKACVDLAEHAGALTTVKDKARCRARAGGPP
jgi:hypothetical protein